MTTGWAFGTPDARPTFGHFTLTPCKGDYGLLIRQFDRQIRPMIEDADFVGYESPIVHGRNTLHVIMITVGLATHFEWMCSEAEKPLMAFKPNTIKKTLTGHGWAKKADMVAVAQELSYDVKVHDEADALGIWFTLVGNYDAARRTNHLSKHLDPLFNGAPTHDRDHPTPSPD